MTTRWIYKEEVDENAAEQLAQEININPIIAKIHLQRDITNLEEARNALSNVSKTILGEGA